MGGDVPSPHPSHVVTVLVVVDSRIYRVRGVSMDYIVRGVLA